MPGITTGSQKRKSNAGQMKTLELYRGCKIKLNYALLVTDARHCAGDAKKNCTAPFPLAEKDGLPCR